MTEFGSLALVDQEEGRDVSLPGVKKGDMAARHWKPEVRVSSIQFSPTGKRYIPSLASVSNVSWVLQLI